MRAGNGRGRKREASRGLGLVEMLVVIAIIGLLVTIALPSMGMLREKGERERNRRNAQQVASLSRAVAALGIAHVLPEALGGAAATARLLREGVVVPSGPMHGERIALPGLGDEEIDAAAPYLKVVFEGGELALEFLKEGAP